MTGCSLGLIGSRVYLYLVQTQTETESGMPVNCSHAVQCGGSLKQQHHVTWGLVIHAALLAPAQVQAQALLGSVCYRILGWFVCTFNFEKYSSREGNQGSVSFPHNRRRGPSPLSVVFFFVFCFWEMGGVLSRQGFSMQPSSP